MTRPRLRRIYSKSSESESPLFQFRTGAAGTGKTHALKKLAEADESSLLLCSTTGISAVNLNTTTLNSVLGYFDEASLLDKYMKGGLTARLHQIGQRYRNLAIDEVSMMSDKALDVIHRAVCEVNEYEGMKKRGRRLGIILTGDMCQLPPVKAKFCFEGESWPAFAENITRLTKSYRQTSPEFLDALNAARRGDGAQAVEILRRICPWKQLLTRGYDGTTVVSRNDEADRVNYLALRELEGRAFILRNTRAGRLRGEWKNIPESLDLKVGAYVMLLANKRNEEKSGVARTADDELGMGAPAKSQTEFEFVNGDCGHIESYDPSTSELLVRLIRNDELVEVQRVYRRNEVEELPDDVESLSYDAKRDKHTIGWLNYWPVRLAYASTCHKVQGLTLDRCQVDLRGGFFSAPSMTYVALSRARTPENLLLVGNPDAVRSKIKIDPRVLPWI